MVTQGVEGVPIAVPPPRQGGHQDVQGGRFVRAVVRGVWHEMQCGELAVTHLVFDLSGLHVTVVVECVGLAARRALASSPAPTGA